MKEILLIIFILIYAHVVICRQKKPHIIFVVADDLGWNDVGWHNPDIKTPHLNKLAWNGVILNNSYVHPICTPSRNSFMTGLYPFRVGLQNGVIGPQQVKHIPEGVPTLPERLKALGYATHMVGKWHLGFCNLKHTPTGRGFDSFMGFYTGAQDYYTHIRGGAYDFRFNESVYHPKKRQYSTKTFAKRAIEILKTSKSSKKPLFLYLAFQSVHTPLQVPKKYENMYRHVKNLQRRKYSAMVTAMDDAIGGIMKAAKKYKYLRNLLFVFITDNGGAATVAGNNLPLRGSKGSLWEGGTRAASFIYSKTLLKKRRYVSNGMIHAVDWYPTLLKLAGWIPYPWEKRIDGVNQWPMLRRNKPSARREFVYSIEPKSDRAAIRMGRYKLIVGKPGMYNNWYSVQTSRYACPLFDDQANKDENSDTRLFLYAGLNSMVDNIKNFMNWAVWKVPGYSSWRRWKKRKLLKQCDRYRKREMSKFKFFPKYLLFDLKKDPEERHNIAGYYPWVVRKLNARLDKYKRYVRKSQTDVISKRADPWKYYNGTWSPGWC